MLRKNSSATFAALIALSLAIGACTAAFSLIDALLLRPLPVAAPDRLVALSYPSIVSGRPDGESFSYPALQRFRQTAGTDAGLFGESSNTGLAETTFGSAEPERARVNWISGQAFGIIGVPPALGRTLNTSDEGQSGAAVLGYDFWKRRFGGSPDVLGNVMRTNGRVFRVVGVTREGFSGFEPGFLTDIWLPLEAELPNPANLANPAVDFFHIWASLKQGVTPGDMLREKLQPAFTAMRRELGPSLAREGVPAAGMPRILSASLNVNPSGTGHAGFCAQFAHPLWILGIVAALVLLIACSNVANLFAARAQMREREMALRAAVGAGRFRLVQQVWIECGFIAVAACIVGLAFAQAAGPATGKPSDAVHHAGLFRCAHERSPVPLYRPRRRRGYAAVQCNSRLACSHRPARGRIEIRRAIFRAHGRHAFSDHGPSGLQLRGLICRCLLLISFRNLMSVDLGFTKQGVVLVGLDGRRVTDAAANRNAILDILRQVRQQPGVESAGMSNIELIAGPFAPMIRPIIRIPGQAGGPQRPLSFRVAPGFFDVMRIRLLSGRDFDGADLAPNLTAAVIVNEVFVRQYLGGGNALNQRFDRTSEEFANGISQLIVGVVSNAKYNSLRENRFAYRL